MKQIILLFACLFALQGLAKADDDRAIKTFGKRNMKLYLSTEKKLNF